MGPNRENPKGRSQNELTEEVQSKLREMGTMARKLYHAEFAPKRNPAALLGFVFLSFLSLAAIAVASWVGIGQGGLAPGPTTPFVSPSPYPTYDNSAIDDLRTELQAEKEARSAAESVAAAVIATATACGNATSKPGMGGDPLSACGSEPAQYSASVSNPSIEPRGNLLERRGQPRYVVWNVRNTGECTWNKIEVLTLPDLQSVPKAQVRLDGALPLEPGEDIKIGIRLVGRRINQWGSSRRLWVLRVNDLPIPPKLTADLDVFDLGAIDLGDDLIRSPLKLPATQP